MFTSGLHMHIHVHSLPGTHMHTHTKKKGKKMKEESNFVATVRLELNSTFLRALKNFSHRRLVFSTLENGFNQLYCLQGT